MKKNKELESFKKMDIKELNAQNVKLRIEMTQKISKLAESGRKNSPEIRTSKRNIARIETVIIQRLDEKVEKDGMKNVK